MDDLLITNALLRWHLSVAADGRTEAPLPFVSPGPASLATHGVAFPCRATSADRLPAVGAAPVDAPARFAPGWHTPGRTGPGPLAGAPD